MSPRVLGEVVSRKAKTEVGKPARGRLIKKKTDDNQT